MESLQSLGWVVAGLLFLYLILREALRNLVVRLVAAVVAGLERRFSGSRWVRARSLRRYRRHIRGHLALVPVPFALPTKISMGDVYIPLRAADQPESSSTDGHVDLAAAVGARRRVLVLGPPGSGKSLFLRHLLWSACADPDERHDGRQDDRPLAVQVALSQLAKSGGIADEIVASFGRHSFANAQDFVRREIDRVDTELLVLFDGLDEVATPNRSMVVKLIAEFAEHHPAVRFVVTCRTEVYAGALDGVVEEVFHVQPFTDELVERFLHSWPDMSHRDAVDRLVNVLRDTPQVAALIRNPLLVTLLAYLYTTEYAESTGLLPHKRAHFYRDATRLLLRRWKDEHNRYRWEAKKVVLQHLALFNQVSGADRRGMVYAVVLEQVNSVLPRVDIARGEAAEILDEIIDRSGLLTRLDAGERLQFAHLTMQEYLAAVELLDRPQEIVDRYSKDPAAWREGLKLWCGAGEQDASDVIREVAPRDLVLALECLADATRVDDSSLADGLIARAQQAFAVAAPDDPLVHAFGILASDHRPRGRATLQFLIDAARSNPAGPHARRRLAVALAASNLPEAMDSLAALAFAPGHDVDLKLYLVTMGNVAVPTLADQAESLFAGPASEAAIDCLVAIGTPRAAQELARLVWSYGEPDLSRTLRLAAVGLAQLSASAAVEDALAAVDLLAWPTSRPRTEPTHWLWQPFVTGRPLAERHRLQDIFGRCLDLLDHVDEDDLTAVQRDLDPRFLVAAMFFHPDGRPRATGSLVAQQMMTEGDDSTFFSLQHSVRNAEGVEFTPVISSSPWDPIAALLGADRRLAAYLDPTLVRELFDLPEIPVEFGEEWSSRARLGERTPLTRADEATIELPRLEDWASHTSTPTAYRFSGSIHHRIPLLAAAGVAMASVPFAIHAAWDTSGWGRVLHGGLALWLLVGLAAIVASVAGRITALNVWTDATEALLAVPLGWLAAVLATSGEVGGWWRSRREGKSHLTDWAGVVTYSALAAFMPGSVYGLLAWLHPPGWRWGVAAAVVFGLLTGGLIARGLLKQRKQRRNPVRALLGPVVLGADAGEPAGLVLT